LKLQDPFVDSAEGKTVDNPASPIAKIIAGEKGVRWEDIDVDVRVKNEKDIASIEQRSDAMTEKILKVLGAAECVVVIVGELHREGMVKRLKANDMSVDWSRFP
jgi:hypothetical protein